MFGKYLLCLITSLLYAPAALSCVVSLAYIDIPSAPFVVGEGLKVPAKPGIAVEIAAAAVTAAGCTVRLVRLPGVRVLRLVGDSDFDGAILYSYEDERSQTLVYPMKYGQPDAERRLATFSYFLYRRKIDRITWNGLVISNPDGKPVGFNSGFAVGELLTKLGVKVDDAKTTEQNLGKLHLGRISGYAMQEHIADPVIQSMHFEQEIEKLPIPLLSKDYYLPFSRKFYAEHKELAEDIWTRIGQTREQTTRNCCRNTANDSSVC